MDKKIKAKWLKALRSGKYKQGTGALCQWDDKCKKEYCCLGVLGDLINPSKWSKKPNSSCNFLYGKKEGMLASKDLRTCGLVDDDARELANMNDDGDSFKKIAKYIEKNL